jgi:hypothetical protein
MKNSIHRGRMMHVQLVVVAAGLAVCSHNYIVLVIPVEQ